MSELELPERPAGVFLSLSSFCYCQNEPLNSAEWLNSSLSLSLSLPPVSALPERETERETAMFSKCSVCSLIKCTQTLLVLMCCFHSEKRSTVFYVIHTQSLHTEY